jgi:hypothetical protein
MLNLFSLSDPQKVNGNFHMTETKWQQLNSHFYIDFLKKNFLKGIPIPLFTFGHKEVSFPFTFWGSSGL